MSCPYCSKPIPPNRVRRHAKYCSNECEVASRAARLRAINPRSGLPHSTVGAMGELTVALDLMSRGGEVFRALNPAASCDLAVLLDGYLLRIEVTTGTCLTSGGVSWGDHRSENYDLIAVVYPGNGLQYVPSGQESPTQANGAASSFEMAIAALRKSRKVSRR